MLARISLLLALLLLLGARAADAQMYDPKNGEPPNHEKNHYTRNVWDIRTTPDGEGVSGTVTLDCYLGDKDVILVSLKGLQGKKTYSVWLVRKTAGVEERAQVVMAWDGPKTKVNTFTAEPDGMAFYRGCLNACPLGVWSRVEVRFHPDGNGSDLQTSTVILSNKVKSE